MRSRLALGLIVLVAGTLLGVASADTTATPGENVTTDAETTIENTTVRTVETTAATPTTVDPGAELAGSGTADDPYVIERADQFRLIDGDLDAEYVLGSDLDFSETAIDPVGANDTVDEATRKFNGTLDGQGHTVENVTVAGPRMPLVRTVGETGRVESLRVVGVDGSGTAAVVDSNRGTIADVHVTGTVLATGEYASAPLVEFNTGTVRSVSGDVTVEGNADGRTRQPTIGGLVGHNEGLIENATVRGEVVGHDGNRAVGGMAATNDRGGRIVDATAHATVEGTNSVGGLVGFNGRATVTDSRATGAVTGENSVGGLVGHSTHEVALGGDDIDATGRIVRSRASGTVTGDDAVGGLVGRSERPIRQSVATGTVSGAQTASGERGGTDVGGLVGLARDDITDSYALGAVRGEESVGGLVGTYDAFDATIDGAYAVGTVDADTESGALVGSVDGTPEASAVYIRGSDTTDPTLGTALTTEQMTGENAMTALSGLDFEGNWTTTDRYPNLAWEQDGEDRVTVRIRPLVDGRQPAAGESFELFVSAVPPENETITSTTTAVTGTTLTGETVRTETDGDRPSLTVEHAGEYTVRTTVETSEGGTAVAERSITVAPSPATLDGAGTADDPYRIASVEGLLAIDAAPDAHYRLVSDIDAGRAVEPLPAIAAEQPADYGSYFDGFGGTLDGAGHTVSDARLGGSGLFAEIGDHGTVRNLTVENASVDGSGEVGLLAGLSHGQIASVTVSGTASGDTVGGLVGNTLGTARNVSADVAVSGEEAVGGLAGSNGGRIEGAVARGDVDGTHGYGADATGGLVGESTGPIVDVRAHGDVTGTDNVGGLAGEQSLGGDTLRRAVATGSVSGGSAVGGLVGTNDADLADVAAHGSVTGDDAVGGLIGRAREASVDGAFATGQVSGTSDVGGIAGTFSDRVDYRTFTDGVYFDTEATGQDPVFADTGRTTAEMTGADAREHLEALDFETTWTTTEEYPRLDRDPTADGPTVSVAFDPGMVRPDGTTTATLRLSGAPEGLSGYNLSVALANDSVATIASVSAPEQFGAIKRVERTGNGTALLKVSDGAGAIDGPARNVTLGTLTIDAAATGTTNVSADVESVQAETGEPYDTEPTADTLTVTDIDRQTVAVDVAPDRVSVNRTTTATVRLDETPAGLSGYEVRVAVANDSVATIESVSAPEEFGPIRSVERTADGAHIKVSDSADAVSGPTSNVTLATVTLRSDEPGATAVTASVDTVMAEDGTPYPTATERGNLAVVDVTAEPIDGTKPQDIDEDWTYEDVNGNGQLDFPDVNTFVQSLDEPVVTDHVAAYDFDGDGDIDLQDALALFEMV
ncbi:GLUG motif-containing protein [Halococcoides cellulosivorans]|nr:GLUG motif-containing protein [Halococcoides cellulosivorans]